MKGNWIFGEQWKVVERGGFLTGIFISELNDVRVSSTIEMNKMLQVNGIILLDVLCY